MKTNILIVGGNETGIAAALTARKFYPELTITVVRKEKNAFIPCRLPYLLRSSNSFENNLIPDKLLSGNKIQLLIDEVTSINQKEKSITTASNQTMEYDKMILATGSKPTIPLTPGSNLKNVFNASRNENHLKKLLDVLKKNQNVTIHGCGLLALEFAFALTKFENLRKISVVESEPNSLLFRDIDLSICDPELCESVKKELHTERIMIYTGQPARTLHGNEKVESVEIANREKISADLVLLAAGTGPDIALACKAGLSVNEASGIHVDDYMRTSDPDIFAAGDCAVKHCFLTGKVLKYRPSSVGATEARSAAMNLFGLRNRRPFPIGIFTTKIGNISVGVAGMTEKMAKEEGFNVITGSTSFPDRYPPDPENHKELQVKLIFLKNTCRLIGGYTSGSDKAGYVINQIGAMIQQETTIDEILSFPTGAHPGLTVSPIANHIQSASENALTHIETFESRTTRKFTFPEGTESVMVSKDGDLILTEI